MMGLLGMVAVFGDAPDDMENAPLYIVGMLSMSVLAFLVIAAAVGTTIPAAAAADKSGLSISLRRAQQTWWRLLLGLLYGPVMSGLITLLVAGLVVNLFGGSWVYSGLPTFHPPHLIGNFIYQWLLLYHIVLTIAALTIAYERVAPTAISAEIIRTRMVRS